MNKRPQKLKQIDHNLSREIKLEAFDKPEIRTLISDDASNASRLFPHVTKRKTQEDTMQDSVYNTFEKQSFKYLSTSNLNPGGKNKSKLSSGSNQNLNFIFQ